MHAIPDPAGQAGASVRVLSDAEWYVIADLVPYFTGPGKIGRPAKHDRRAIVSAIVHVTTTGCPWRKLPDCFPHWNTVHRYWSGDGTWARVSERLAVTPSAGRSGSHA